MEVERRAQAANFNTVRAGLHLGLGLVQLDAGKKTLETDRARAAGLLQSAVDELEQTAKLAPTAPALRRLAQAYSAMRRKPDAEKVYRDCVALAPGDFGCHYDLGGILYEARRYPEALVEMQAIRRSALEPSELSDYHYGIGLVRLDGFGDRQRALAINPAHNRKTHMQRLIEQFTRAGLQPVAEE
jgi:tetratricopeptide (TPR) repeat protein